MKNFDIFKSAVNRLHAFSVMLIMMLCVSVTAQGKTAVAWLANSQQADRYILVFEYIDYSKYDYPSGRSWSGNEVLDTSNSSGLPPWSSWASKIIEVQIMPSFKSVTPKNMRAWFKDCVNLTEIKGLENLNTSKVVNMSCTFENCEKLTSLNLYSFNTPELLYVREMFSGCKALTSINISNFYTSKIRSYERMFSGCESLTSLSFTSFDFGNTDDSPDRLYPQADYMFTDCKSLESIALYKFKNTSKLTSLHGMFAGCKSLQSFSIPESFNTSNVTDMCALFKDCSNLEWLVFPESFDTSKVTDMSSMFEGCHYIKNLDLRYFNTANVTNMGSMFYAMWLLKKLNITSFNTANVQYMSNMFVNCASIEKLDLHNFRTDNLEETTNMFSGCSSLTTIYATGTWKSSVSSSGMFNNCSKLVGAIAYDPNKQTAIYANTTSGYFTKMEYYNLKICGERVTNANRYDLTVIKGVKLQDPSGEGHIYYVKDDNTLHLKGVILEAVDESCIETMEDRGCDIHVEKCGNYYVRLYGSCTTPSKAKPVMNLTCSEMVSASIYNDTDEEKGFLLVDGSGPGGNNPVPAIVTTGPLTIYRTSVEAIGSYGICGGTDGVGKNTRLSIWDDTEVSARGSVGGSICNFNELMIWGMITYPEGATDGANAVELNGQVVKDWVSIGRAVYKYGIFIAGEAVTNINCDDLTTIKGVTVGDGGYIRFNLGTKTLEMESCYIQGGMRNTLDGLKIKVGKQYFLGNIISSNDGDGLVIEAPTTITANAEFFKSGSFDGFLRVNGKGSGIVLKGSKAQLTVQDAALAGIGTNGAGITGENYYASNYNNLIIKGLSYVGGKGSTYSFGELNLQLDNENLKVIEPEGGRFTQNYVRTKFLEIVKGENATISYYNPADVNVDGEVNISDVVAEINTMAGDETFKNTADVNSDGERNISDVVAIINVMAGGEVPLPSRDAASEAGYCPNANHPHVIDMGSAGKWACCNVGASAPWEYGGYYAWGETEEKSTYNWSTYKHCDGSNTTLHDIGTDIAGTQYDVAHVKWQGNWQMPNYDQAKLLTQCSGELTTLNNVPGRKYIGSNGNYIFLPLPGIMRPTGFDTSDVDVHGWYWSSVPSSSLSESIYGFWFYTTDGTVNSGLVSSRPNGLPVRPVSK